MFAYVSKHFKGPQELVKRALTTLGSCFFVWLVMHNKCWIADRFSQGGLPHPASCLPCDQANENINHRLVSCVFVWQFWYSLLQSVVLKSLSTQLEFL